MLWEGIRQDRNRPFWKGNVNPRKRDQQILKLTKTVYLDFRVVRLNADTAIQPVLARLNSQYRTGPGIRTGTGVPNRDSQVGTRKLCD